MLDVLADTRHDLERGSRQLAMRRGKLASLRAAVSNGVSGGRVDWGGGICVVMSLIEPTVPETATRADFEVVLPDVGQDLDQDEEWCEILVGGERRRIRFHDYHKIYEIPGFYERLFYDRLKCESPRVIRRLLAQVLAELETEPGELRVLDVGAGNGTVAALGFDDITPHAFTVAYNLISTPGLVAFTIKENFVAKHDLSGFSGLIRQMFDEQVIRLLVKERYRHRLSVQGEPLYYVALVTEKVSDVSQAWLD